MAGSSPDRHGRDASGDDAASPEELEPASLTPRDQAELSPTAETDRNGGDAIETRTEIIASSRTFSGPLPPPEDLAAYEEVHPGAADRILAMAERQAKHRQALESASVAAGNHRAMVGQILATVVTLSALAVAGILAYLGHGGLGTATALVPIGALAGTFIYGTQSGRRERKQQLKETLAPTPADDGSSKGPAGPDNRANPEGAR